MFKSADQEWSYKKKVLSGVPERTGAAGPLQQSVCCMDPRSKAAERSRKQVKISVTKYVHSYRATPFKKVLITVIRLIASLLADGIKLERGTPESYKMTTVSP